MFGLRVQQNFFLVRSNFPVKRRGTFFENDDRGSNGRFERVCTQPNEKDFSKS
jgi:hypothetical protein